jgi:hypothetical protein
MGIRAGFSFLRMTRRSARHRAALFREIRAELSARLLPSPVGSGEMRNLLAEYPAWFEPDEVQILVAAFDKAWETVQASSIRYPADKLESVRAILAKRIIAAAMDGERDLGRLRDGALLALAQSTL